MLCSCVIVSLFVVVAVICVVFCFQLCDVECVDVACSALWACVGVRVFGGMSAVETVCVCYYDACFWFSFLDQVFSVR